MSGAVSSAMRRVLASLYEVVETETSYGGQARSFELIGQVWLAPGKVTARAPVGPDGARRVERQSVSTLADDRLGVGRVLEWADTRWRILGVAGDGHGLQVELEHLP